MKAIKMIGLVIAILAVLIGLTRPWTWKRGKEEEFKKLEKVLVETKNQNIIVLKPGENISLEIDTAEWSHWIDVSYKGMYANVKIQGDRIYQFLDGKIDTVKKGDAVRLPGDVYRIKAVDSTRIAIIKTAMRPINRDLY